MFTLLLGHAIREIGRGVMLSVGWRLADGVGSGGRKVRDEVKNFRAYKKANRGDDSGDAATQDVFNTKS